MGNLEYETEQNRILKEKFEKDHIKGYVPIYESERRIKEFLNMKLA